MFLYIYLVNKSHEKTKNNIQTNLSLLLHCMWLSALCPLVPNVDVNLEKQDLNT